MASALAWFQSAQLPGGGRESSRAEDLLRRPISGSRGLSSSHGAPTRFPCVHLDSILLYHHDANMRTTITLDKDVERMLRDAMHRSRTSFKQTLNSALRAGLRGRPARPKRTAFVVRAKSMKLRAGFDVTGFNRLVDDLEADAFLAKTRTPSRA